MITLDKIEKQVLLGAPLDRVWHAITDTQQFGRWFGVHLNGQFAAGKTMTGTFDQEIDQATMEQHQINMGLPPSPIRQPQNPLVFCTVERIEPQHYFSFKWIPFGIDADVNPDTEPTTLVEFFLQQTTNGTLLKIVESGFEQVPEHRRERAFRMNQGGWAAQAENIKKYVETR